MLRNFYSMNGISLPIFIKYYTFFILRSPYHYIRKANLEIGNQYSV